MLNFLKNLIATQITKATSTDRVSAARVRNVLNAFADTIQKDIAFSVDITFDCLCGNMGTVQGTSNFAFNPVLQNAIPYGGRVVRIVGDGSHVPTFTGWQKTSNSADYDSTLNKVNQIIFFWDGSDPCYQISLTDGSTATTGLDTTPPTVTSRTATAANTIQIVFSEPVSANLAGWSFKKNGVALGISSVTGSGTNTLIFTTSVPMLSTDTLLVSYNSGTGVTRDLSNNNLGTFTDISITNSIAGGDVTPPVLSTATVETAQPNRVVLTYNETLNGSSVPAVGNFVATVNGVDRTTTSVTIAGAVVNVNFDGAAVTAGQTVVIDYVVPGANQIKDVAGNNAAAFTNQAVTNNVSGGSYDTDAQAIIDAKNTAGAAWNTAKQDAVNAFIVAGKAHGWWTKMRQFGNLSDGSFAKNKINWKSPGTKDLSSSNGTITYGANGATGDGSTGYINTGFNPYVEFTDSYNCLGIYQRTAALGGNNFSMGAGGTNPISGSDVQFITAVAVGGNALTRIDDSGIQAITATDSQGFFIGNRTTDTDLKLDKNGANIASSTTNDSNRGMPNVNMYLLGSNLAGVLTFPTAGEISFWFIGKALTTTERSDFNTDFQALKTVFGW